MEGEPRAVAIVVHGMFIDILTKVLTGCEMTTGKQPMVFCSQNAGMPCELKPGTEDNPRIGVCSASTSSITFPRDQNGGSVEGLDDCYMNEGSA